VSSRVERALITPRASRPRTSTARPASHSVNAEALVPRKKKRRHAAVLARLLPKNTELGQAVGDVPPIVHEILDLHVPQFLVLQRAYRALKKSETPTNSGKLVSSLPLVWDVEGARRRAGPRSKLTDEQIVEVKELQEQNPKVCPTRQLAKKFKVSAPAIARALRRPGK